jgi:hypothetical protein
MAHRVLLTAVLVVIVANPALANWWIVRASDGKCVVVDIEPTGKDKDNLYPPSLSENVRYGSLADILTSSRHVRFTPDSGHSSAY